MRAWSFAAIGVVVIQSVLMMAYTTYADTSSSSRFRLQDSFSVVAGGSETSSTYAIRDRGGEASPRTMISQTLEGVIETTSANAYSMFQRIASSVGAAVADVLPSKQDDAVQPSAPSEDTSPAALPTTTTLTPTPTSATPSSRDVEIPSTPQPSPTPTILDVPTRVIFPIVEPIAKQITQLVPSTTGRSGSKAIEIPVEAVKPQEPVVDVSPAPTVPAEPLAVSEKITTTIQKKIVQPVTHVINSATGKTRRTVATAQERIITLSKRIIEKTTGAAHSVTRATTTMFEHITNWFRAFGREIKKKVGVQLWFVPRNIFAQTPDEEEVATTPEQPKEQVIYFSGVPYVRPQRAEEQFQWEEVVHQVEQFKQNILDFELRNPTFVILGLDPRIQK